VQKYEKASSKLQHNWQKSISLSLTGQFQAYDNRDQQGRQNQKS